MWQLKFIQEHSDCMYSPILKRLHLTMYGYALNHDFEKRKLVVTNLQILSGASQNIGKYIAYLKKLRSLFHFERISDHAFLFQLQLTENYHYYQTIYTPHIFYVSPIIHKDGREWFTVASWNREHLERIIKNVEKNRHTRYFKLLHLKQVQAPHIFIPQVFPHLTEHQREILRISKEQGYWNYPRKTNLNALAKVLKKSKSTVHETLRRAEARLMEYFI